MLADNPLLRTDSYKLGHMVQTAPGCTKVYSHLIARSDKTYQKLVFFGLQYYLKRYLQQRITREHADEFFRVYESILGQWASDDVRQKINALVDLGYWPLKIKAIPEGTVIPPKQVLMTICNTRPEFYWCVGFVESLLLKVWASTTTASCSYRYRELVTKYWRETVDDGEFGAIPFAVHDFGYRGCDSEEGAALSGVGHLLNFTGSDTVPAYGCANRYYGAYGQFMQSVPASEHSVMCSFGRDDELGAFRHMLNTYPTGIVSIVSDTFDVYKVLTDFCEELKPQIMARDGKTVFRPDSGDPAKIICGDPQADPDSPQFRGALCLLFDKFGGHFNSKGYIVLNPKVSLIYGDGMYLERYEYILKLMKSMRFAASNLVIGVGGILRNHTRDTLGFAIKATYVEVDGQPREIEKDPVTDPGKKSMKGLLRLDHTDAGWVTTDRATPWQEAGGELRTVFEDGHLLIEDDLETLRQRRQDCELMEASLAQKQAA